MAPRSPALSASRAREYMQCPLKFRFSVVDNIPQPPTEATIKGILVHSVLERLFSLPASERTEESALELLGPEWRRAQENNAQYLPVIEATSGVDQLLADSSQLLDHYFRIEQPQNLDPDAVEEFMEVRLPNGILVRGIVDRVDRAPDGRLRVVDYKTGKAPAPRFVGEALFQMRFYALMLREIDRLPTRMQLLYLRTQSVLTLDPEPADIDRFEGELASLWQRIAADATAGRFPTKQGPLCGWCPYQSLCPAFGGRPAPPPEAGLDRLLAVRQP